MPFDIPVTFTIAPHDPAVDLPGFLRYAQRMNGLTEAEYHTILTGIIHGQTRILAGGVHAVACSGADPSACLIAGLHDCLHKPERHLQDMSTLPTSGVSNVHHIPRIGQARWR